MNYLLLAAGIIIIVAVVYDFVFTAFSPKGAGIFTHGISVFLYKLFRGICIKLNAMKLLEGAGIIIIVVILVFWYLSIWMGASLIIISDPHSILNNATQNYADLSEKFYYTGFTISTLGGGDYSPTSAVWQIFTVVFAFLGFALITTGVSYMVPVLSAVVNKRTLATYISLLGTNPQEILRNQWKGDGFRTLEEHLPKLSEMIIQHSQQLLAYPVIYCFYSYNPHKSAGLNIAKLDEALSILLLNISEENRPSEQSIRSLRNAISEYLHVQKDYFINLKDSDLDLPEMKQLKEAGIPLVYEQDNLAEVYEDLDDRRKILGAIQKDQRRDFSDIYENRFLLNSR